ncbi:hypothetical protein [Fictibacillus gelatini]|uniref:hypothetical protein n=1 Tax=Fictibacillus gelatini TaxID=225985 RepID=UPI0003F85447|nr:hypothetical protein [Fictibacillus gelatini]
MKKSKDLIVKALSILVVGMVIAQFVATVCTFTMILMTKEVWIMILVCLVYFMMNRQFKRSEVK